MMYEVPLRDKLTLTIPEAEALSGIPAKVIRAQVKAGMLPARYASSSTPRIRRQDLDEWLLALPTAVSQIA